ncbi:MAG: DUF1501 domain-containing protein [Planctomycetales bacterium]
MALAHLLARDGMLGADAPISSGWGPSLDLRSRSGHHPAPARSIILLFQNGGPSQMDLFDPKPELAKRNGQQHPEQVETLQPGNSNQLMASPFKFQKYGQCGMEFSELLPHLGSLADDLCLVRSMHGENNNHPQALRIMLTGKLFPGRPTLGAWVAYGLGTENQNLPAFVALRDPKGYNSGGPLNWDSGWLPAVYRGTEFQSQGAPVLNLQSAIPLPRGAQRADLELLARLNEAHRERNPFESDLEARIRHYELAARMQLSAEGVLDLAQETAATRALYGLDEPTTADYGKRCLMARRLVESGVRFVHVEAPARTPWDNHSNLKQGIEQIASKVDRPAAALIQDLKQRGLLSSTIVLWGGEFGRLPTSQNGDGRDHNRHGFGLVLAGGGFKAGHRHGATDEFGYKAVEGRVSCPDLLATLLHQVGLDHERLHYIHAGREETLTDPAVTRARVVDELLDA